MHRRIIEPPYRPADTTRSAARVDVALPARLTWKDHRGTARFAAVVTRNVSEFGVYVECQTPVSLPLYRLVHFQLDRDLKDGDPLPGSLKGRLIAAVYRVAPPDARGHGQGIALRLMVEPKRRTGQQTLPAAAPVRASA